MLSYLKKNYQNFIIGLLIIGIILAGYFLSKKLVVTNKNLTSNENIEQICKDNIFETTPIDVGNLPPYGNTEAPIKIIEFSDYLCGFCALTAIDFYPKLEPLIKNNELVLFYRDFPIIKNSDLVANAARCANEQGKFWEFNLKIFQRNLNMQDITQKNIWLDIAKELKLNNQKFEACVENNKYIQDVKNDLNIAKDQKLTGTPTFFIQSENKAFKVSGLDESCLMSTINNLKNQIK